MKPNYVYVASSWNNHMQIAVVAALRASKIDCYDFKNPAPVDNGFHWSDVLSSYEKGGTRDQTVPVEEYLECLQHPIAEAGFGKDWDAMQKADCCILVLPCGRSAHLELGYFVGAKKKCAILLESDQVLPELMYKMVDYITPSLFDLLGWLGVED